MTFLKSFLRNQLFVNGLKAELPEALCLAVLRNNFSLLGYDFIFWDDSVQFL